jgi:hypothetical protein
LQRLNNDENDVRFGSEGDMSAANGHVCFAPESGHVRRSYRCPLWADFVAKVVCDFGEQ